MGGQAAWLKGRTPGGEWEFDGSSFGPDLKELAELTGLPEKELAFE